MPEKQSWFSDYLKIYAFRILWQSKYSWVRRMNKITRGCAYFLLYTTPIQLIFLLWVLNLIISSDFTIISLSTDMFVNQKLPWFKAWIYSWFWNAWLDFWWQYPAFIMISIKTILNCLLGVWLFRIANTREIKLR